MYWLAIVALAAVSIAAVALFTRRTITVAFFWWIGWVLGTGAAVSMSGDGLMPIFGVAGRALVLQAHLGACAGFVLAAIAYHVVVAGTVGPRRLAGFQRERVDRLSLSPGVVAGALLLQFVLGSVMLSHRLQEAGGFAGLATLMNLRATFLEATYLVKELPFAVRLSGHLSLVLAPFPFLFAMQDALDERPRLGRILLWWLVSAPAGLSSGGRGWIIGPPTIYAFTYLVAAPGLFNSVAIRKLITRGALALVAMIGLFGLIERLRTRDSLSTQLFERSTGERWYHATPSLIPVVYYLGLPTLAVETHAGFAEAMPRHGGTLLLPFATAQAARLGVPIGQGSLGEFTRAVRGASFRSSHPILAATHSTIVPLAVGDFGSGRVAVTVGVLCFAMEFAYLFLRRRGILRRFVAVQIATYGGFWSFQEFGLVHAGAILPPLWLALLLAGAILSHPDAARRWLRLERSRGGHAGGVPTLVQQPGLP